MTSDKTILTEEQVAEIAARANAATPGPFEHVPGASLWIGDEESPDETLSGDAILGPDKSVIVANTHYDLEPKSEDMELFAHARADVPALCASHEALRAQLIRANADANKYNAEANRLTRELEEAREALGCFTLSDETWRILDVDNMRDEDTLYSWSVRSYRNARRVLTRTQSTPVARKQALDEMARQAVADGTYDIVPDGWPVREEGK